MPELSEYGKMKKEEINLISSKIWKPIYEEILRLQRGEDIREDIKKIKGRIEALENKKKNKNQGNIKP